jgi:Myb/SANT-like DNA-binding domain
MRDFGYHRSTEEINTRIKNLKCFYNRTKKELDSGEINMTLWRHYEAMDEIMTRPIFGNIGTQLEYQNIYDAKRKMSSVEPTDHLQIISSESANDDEMTVKEELPSDEEVDNSEVVMQLLMQAKALARKKKAQEKADAEAQAEAQAAGNGELVVPKLEPLDEPLEEVTITKASSTTNPPTSMPALTITSVSNKASDAGKSAVDAAAVTSSVPQSKISLVPTNVLMKPQSQQQPAPTVSYPQPKFIIQNTSPATSVAGSQPMPPMQLVFLQTPPTSNNGTSIIGSVANSLPSLATVTTTTPSRPPLPMLKPKPALPTQTVQYTLQQNGHTPQNYSQANGHARSMQASTPTPNGTNRRDSAERNLLKKLETEGSSPNGEKKGLGKLPQSIFDFFFNGF